MSKLRLVTLGLIAAAIGLGSMQTACQAALKSFATYAVSDASTHSASATFSLYTNGTLKIVVTNTYAGYYSTPTRTDVLAGLLFSLDSVTKPMLAYAGAFVNSSPTVGESSGSTITNATTVSASTISTGNVTAPQPTVGGWEYRQGAAVSSKLNSAYYAFGTVGYDIFDRGTKGSTNNNIDYGLIGHNYVPGTGNGGIVRREISAPLITNSVVFTLTGVPSNFDLTKLKNVQFQWGTALSETRLTGTLTDFSGQGGPVVPEPTSLALAGFAGIGFALRALRRQRTQKSDQTA